MKVLLIISTLAALSAAYVGRDVHGRNLDGFVNDFGRDDRVHDRSFLGDNTRGFSWNNNFRNFDNSHERVYGVGFDGDVSRERTGTFTHFSDRNRVGHTDSVEHFAGNRLRDTSVERDHTDGYRNKIVTIDNVDKKYTKFDDDIKNNIIGDGYLRVKQQLILNVLRNVFATWTDDEKVRDAGRLVEDEHSYKNFDKVVDFFRMIRSKNGILPRGRVFVIKNRVHINQLNRLFNLFVNSKDFNVFQRNVLWARKHVNEEMFVHALYASVIHRNDMNGVKLPAIYEVFPHKFHSSLTLDKAWRLRNSYAGKDHRDLIVVNQYTDNYVTLNEEGKLAYLTEDIGWNMYNFYFHTTFAAWIGGKDFKLNTERRGEKYLWLIQQLLARYRLERLSHGLSDVKQISFRENIKTGYNPFMKHFNGLPVSYRNNYYDVRSTQDFWRMERVRDFDRRIRDAIDRGFVETFDGGKFDIRRDDGIDILGNIIQGNKDSVNDRFYGGLIRTVTTLLGGGHVKDVDDYNLVPSVMESHETALRDPVTYLMFKRLLNYYHRFKDSLPTYKREDLILNGVRVDNIKTSPLVTYFDAFDVDISNFIRNDRNRFDDKVVDGKGGSDSIDRITSDNIVRARHMRLNHKPFNVKIDLTVDTPQKVVFRTFIGPKFDENGKIIDIRRNRENFVEIDKFTRDLKQGRVTIEKHSRDFLYTVKDHSTFVDIYKNVLLNDNVNRLVDLHVDEANCGFPDRLILPKGWTGGLPMQLFVIVTRAKDVVKRDTNRTLFCGKRTFVNEVDDWSLGFPFDRRIDLGEFYTQNMFFKDVFIFHDAGDIKKIKDFDGKVIDSKEFVDVQRFN